MSFENENRSSEPYPILNAVSMSASRNAVFNNKNQRLVVIQAVFTTSDAVGTFDVLVSTDEAGTYESLGLTISPAASADGVRSLDIETGFPWIKFVYTRTSGTGTLTVRYAGKR